MKPSLQPVLLAVAVGVLTIGKAPAAQIVDLPAEGGANLPAPKAIYTFTQNGKTSQYILSADEVADVDEEGETVVRPMAIGRAALLERASNPPAGLEASHLVFYPIDQPGVESARRLMRQRLAVRLSPGTNLEELRNRLGAVEIRQRPYSDDRAVVVFDNAAEALGKLGQVAGDADVVSVEPLLARMLQPHIAPTDPLYPYVNGPYQWHLNNTGQEGALAGTDANSEAGWDLFADPPANTTPITGAGVTIGIVDEGTETDHPDLEGNIDLANSNNWNGGANDPGDPNPEFPWETHGTSVAGVAAAVWNNGEGGSGAAPEASIAGLRLIAGPVDDAQVGEALTWQLDNIDIYNNSWGIRQDMAELVWLGDDSVDAILDGVENGRGTNGAIYVFSAGNSAEDNDNANNSQSVNLPETIGVGAIDDGGQRAYYSEPGACLVISAPSGGGNLDITTTTYRGEPEDPDADPLVYPFDAYTDEFSGTSSAAPLVSGVIALMLQANPALGWRDVQEILMASAVKNDEFDPDWVDNAAGFHFNHEYGAGMVDAEAAVMMAAGWTNLGTRTSQVVTRIPIFEDTVNSGEIPENGDSYVVQFDFSAMTNLRVEHVQIVTTAIHDRRADLEIVLISPNGTQSVLQNSFPNSEEQSISDWPFMTTRCWGEGSAGIWALRFVDKVPNGEDGFVNDVQLVLHGVEDAGAPISQSPLLISSRVIRGVEGSFLSYQLEEIGAETIGVGTLPPGLTWNPLTKTITGTPTTAGVTATPLTLTGPAPDNLVTNTTLSFLIEPLGTSLGAAVEQDARPTLTSGTGISGGWIYEFVDTYDGIDSAGSPLTMADNESSQFGFILNPPLPGEDPLEVIEFFYRTSSEEGKDILYYYQGSGQPPQNWKCFISGGTDWKKAAVRLPATLGGIFWQYRKNASGAVGDDRAFVDQVSFRTSSDFDTEVVEALDLDYAGAPSVVQTGRTLWMAVDDPAATDMKAIRNSGIGHGQSVILESTLIGPGILDFKWKTSSQEDSLGNGSGGDVLSLIVDGLTVEMISGAEPNYLPVQVNIPEGEVQVKWQYRKNGTISVGEDAAWLDEVKYLQQFTYALWQGLNFTEAEIMSGMADRTFDKDGDGRDNFFEYAWGSDPNVPDVSPNLPMVAATGGSLTISYKQDISRTDLTYQLQSSPDLSPGSWVNETPTAGVLEGNLQTYELVWFPFGERYFRVLVTENP